jgi:branched-chain amino acid transport system permease protein
MPPGALAGQWRHLKPACKEDFKVDIYLFLTITIAGIFTGGIYALLAVPFNFQLGALKVTNFAYGNTIMLSMYMVFVLTTQNVPLAAAVPLLLVIMFVYGLILRRYIVFTQNENVQILLTMGVAIFMENLAQAIWGGFPRSLGATEKGIFWNDIYISQSRLEVFVLTLICLAIGYIFLQKSWYGRCIRATVQQPDMAQVMGINVRNVTIIAFAASTCYVAIATFCLMRFYAVEPHTGGTFLSLCFLIAVLGGLGNLKGSFFASFIIGIISSFVAFLAPGYHDPIIFLLFIILILLRPTGLFGEA